ncbi:MAG: cytochrome c family protein [Deltaproteobacteria bacterium]|nr:cytochrome c family protein [Deltaproteobacteria bacterium]
MSARRAIAAGLVAGGALACPGVARAVPAEPLALQNPITPWHNCSACHRFPNDVKRLDEPNRSPMLWQGSMMANSARDPVFWAGVAIAAQDEPTETVDCVRCHAPRAFLEGRGGAIAIDELQPDDFGGVSCDLCHRMVDDGVTAAGNARYVIDDVAVDGLVPRRGPWTYAPGEPSPPHPWTDDADHLASSRMCGTCHDVTTGRERVGDDGVGLGVGFNEQRTYSEWLGSVYAQPGDDFRSCQSCHMPAVEDVAGCEMHALNGDTHPQGRRHDLVGSGRHMMGILQQLYGSAGTQTIPDFHFDDSMERVDQFLTEAATVQIEAPAMVDVAAGLQDLLVTVTNESGHKLPTGYSEGRVMWLELTASYQGQRLWSSGEWAPGVGLVDDPQLRRYEAIAERFADGEQLHLLHNDHWVVDHRIPPRGLLPDLETDPVGGRYPLQPDGTWAHFDEVSYAFAGRAVEDATPGEPDTLTIEARLLLVVNTPEYVEFLAAANQTNDAGDRVSELFADYGEPEPLVVATASVDVPLTGLSDPPSADSTGAGTSTTASDETTGATTPMGTGSTAATTSGAAADDGADQGCGCSTRRHRGADIGGWALLMLLWVRRRATT